MSELIPIIFLRSKDAADEYQTQFSKIEDDIKYDSIFVPVVEHKFNESEFDCLRKILHEKKIGKEIESEYGGLIFTSQRAVEAFALLILEGIENGSGDYRDWPYLQYSPIYAVGPATNRALKSIPLDHPLNIRGSDSGNGESLAEYILEDYPEWYRDWDFQNPLIYVTCERRNDAILKILTNPEIGPDAIPTVELDIYTTSILPTFEQNLIHSLQSKKTNNLVWIVIFSPLGGEAMLRALNLIDPKTGKAMARPPHSRRRIFFASIGPTTYGSLKKNFGFDADVCATKPTPESLEKSIRHYLLNEY
ncbi:Uroporphyrinogen-III synthase [Golovinomyces cichoracearum]|uniref:Uroporphyrinogen-III synthase n=1 Tax=Golovinomyces cichoracearum TaxID=62708 RepID=A0A420J2B9_9PEZI|nr:Uroporphyrinogen-III synthase [Golovinomyces cichoracearum]